ncbi:MAG TPA: Nif3-like dinuclear metal center hexameric protein [Cytophagales bacterium]|nr:Nif3-like dinuclear metal center hexameric protein [Cytophagales bacterium]
MLKIKDLTQYLDKVVPATYMESYDNVGLLVGSPTAELTGVMVSLDMTEAVIEEAVAEGCNLIVAHHPIIFKGLKRLTGSNYVERTVMLALEKGVRLYAAHTNLDNQHTGVNRVIADRLGLESPTILAPKSQTLQKLITYIPQEATDSVMEAIHQEGAGQIGNYSHCSFRVVGQGAFQAEEGAQPTVGAVGNLEKVTEDRVEVMFPMHLQGKVVAALKKAHPYEEVAYYIHSTENVNQEIGAGMIGTLPEAMEGTAFLDYLKERMDLTALRHTPMPQQPIKKVAVCGGAGSFLIKAARRAGADAYVTADVKYHEFFDAEDQMMIADIGHYESEVYTKELLKNIIRENFPNIAVRLSKVVTNPLRYY